MGVLSALFFPRITLAMLEGASKTDVHQCWQNCSIPRLFFEFLQFWLSKGDHVSSHTLKFCAIINLYRPVFKHLLRVLDNISTNTRIWIYIAFSFGLIKSRPSEKQSISVENKQTNTSCPHCWCTDCKKFHAGQKKKKKKESIVF